MCLIYYVKIEIVEKLCNEIIIQNNFILNTYEN